MAHTIQTPSGATWIGNSDCSGAMHYQLPPMHRHMPLLKPMAERVIVTIPGDDLRALFDYCFASHAPAPTDRMAPQQCTHIWTRYDVSKRGRVCGDCDAVLPDSGGGWQQPSQTPAAAAPINRKGPDKPDAHPTHNWKQIDSVDLKICVGCGCYSDQVAATLACHSPSPSEAQSERAAAVDRVLEAQVKCEADAFMNGMAEMSTKVVQPMEQITIDMLRERDELIKVLAMTATALSIQSNGRFWQCLKCPNITYSHNLNHPCSTCGNTVSSGYWTSTTFEKWAEQHQAAIKEMCEANIATARSEITAAKAKGVAP